MGKTIGEIHAMLIEYEKGLPKKAERPQVMMIKNGKIQKTNKKSLNAKGKNSWRQLRNACPQSVRRSRWNHRKWNCPVLSAEGLVQKKRKQVGSSSSSRNICIGQNKDLGTKKEAETRSSLLVRGQSEFVAQKEAIVKFMT
ncbi:hypothetical protein Tco_0040589 [Tanacetum coccineum]